MQFFDKVVAKNTRRTGDGYLVADAPVARIGVQLYRGAELGRPDLPFVRVLRPEDEVFATDSLHSYAYRPMTNDHPHDLVNSTNWKDFAIGQTGGEVVRDGHTVRVPLVLMDEAAIKQFEGGKRELSMGYTAEIEFLDAEGETDDGLKYDAVQRNLRMNHLALVHKGRAGVARIGDEQDPTTLPNNSGGQTMAEVKMRQVVVDGLTIDVTEQGAQVIDRLQKQLADSGQALTDAQAAHTVVLATKDTELAARDATIAQLQGQQVSDADLDARVQKRAALVAQATKLLDADYTGKSDVEIRTTVVAAKCGDAAVTGKSEAYIDARFDALVEGTGANTVDPVRKALGDSVPNVVVADADKAYADYTNHLQNAYLGDTAK